MTAHQAADHDLRRRLLLRRGGGDQEDADGAEYRSSTIGSGEDAQAAAEAARIRDVMMQQPSAGRVQLWGADAMSLIVAHRPAAAAAHGVTFLAVLRTALISHAASPNVISAVFLAVARICYARPDLLFGSAVLRFVPAVNSGLLSFPQVPELVANAVTATRVLLACPENQALALAVGLLDTLSRCDDSYARSILDGFGFRPPPAPPYQQPPPPPPPMAPPPPPPPMAPPPEAAAQRPVLHDVQQAYDSEHWCFYEAADSRTRERIDREEERMLPPPDAQADARLPLRFRVLLSERIECRETKRLLLGRADEMSRTPCDGPDHAKQSRWLRLAMDLPYARVVTHPVHAGSQPADIAAFLHAARRDMDAAVHQNTRAKHAIIRILARIVTNPRGKGAAIGLFGPPGCGKTALARAGFAAGLHTPIRIIPLGGVSDPVHLVGHSHTYVDSSCGALANALISCGVSNPVIVLDELDKVGDGPGGRACVDALIHATDPAHNDAFSDAYFAGVPIDLSRCVLVFTYNDPAAVNPVLLDRLEQIEIPGYAPDDKARILRTHLLPRCAANYGVALRDVELTPGAERAFAAGAADPGMRSIERALDEAFGAAHIRNLIDGAVAPRVRIDAAAATAALRLATDAKAGGSRSRPESMYT